MLLGFLLCRVCSLRRWPEAVRRRPVAWGALAALALGALDEASQHLVPFRTPEWADLGADVLGAALGALLFALWWRARAATAAPRGRRREGRQRSVRGES